MLSSVAREMPSDTGKISKKSMSPASANAGTGTANASRKPGACCEANGDATQGQEGRVKAAREPILTFSQARVSGQPTLTCRR